MPGGASNRVTRCTSPYRAIGHETDPRLKTGILESLVLNDGIGEGIQDGKWAYDGTLESANIERRGRRRSVQE